MNSRTMRVESTPSGSKEHDAKKGISPTSVVMESMWSQFDDEEDMPMDEAAYKSERAANPTIPAVGPTPTAGINNNTGNYGNAEDVIYESSIHLPNNAGVGLVGHSILGIPTNYNNNDDRSIVSSLDGYSVTGGGSPNYHNNDQQTHSPQNSPKKNHLKQQQQQQQASATNYEDEYQSPNKRKNASRSGYRKVRDAVSPVATGTATTVPVTSSSSNSSAESSSHPSSGRASNNRGAAVVAAAPAAGGVRIGRVNRGSIHLTAQPQQSQKQAIQKQQQHRPAQQQLHRRDVNESIEEVSSLDGGNDSSSPNKTTTISAAATPIKHNKTPTSDANKNANKSTNRLNRNLTNTPSPRISRSSPSPAPTANTSASSATSSSSVSRHTPKYMSPARQRILNSQSKKRSEAVRSLSSLRPKRDTSGTLTTANTTKQQPNPSLSIASSQRSTSVPKERRSGSTGRAGNLSSQRSTSLAMAAAAVRKSRVSAAAAAAANGGKKDTASNDTSPSSLSPQKKTRSDSSSIATQNKSRSFTATTTTDSVSKSNEENKTAPATQAKMTAAASLRHSMMRQEQVKKKQWVQNVVSSLDSLYPSQEDSANKDAPSQKKRSIQEEKKDAEDEESQILTKVADIIQKHHCASSTTMKQLERQVEEQQKNQGTFQAKERSLEKQMKQKMEQIESLEKQLEEAQSKIDSMESNKITAQKEERKDEDTAKMIRELTKELQNLTAENEHLEHQHQTLQQDYNAQTTTLEHQIKVLTQEHEDTCQELRAAIDALQVEKCEYQENRAKEEEEHENAILAIQRVLADVTVRKDEKIEGLEEQIGDLMAQKCALQESLTRALEEIKKGERDAGDKGGDVAVRSRSLDVAEADGQFVTVSKDELTCLQEQANRAKEFEEQTNKFKNSYGCDDNDDESDVVMKARNKDELLSSELLRRVQSEKELKEVKTKLEYSRKREEELTCTLDKNRALVFDLEKKLKENEQSNVLQEEDAEILRSRSIDIFENSNRNDEREAMKKQLQEKDQSLENAKRMISSLETSNESTVSELRDKLKQKEEELKTLEKKSNREKKSKDALKAEVSQLRQKNEETERANRQARDRLRKQRILHRQMRGAVDELVEKNNSEERAVNMNSSNVMEQMTSVMRNALCMMDVEGNNGGANLSRCAPGSQGGGDKFSKEKRLAVSISRLLSADGEEQIQEMKKELDDMKSTKEMTENELKSEREERTQTIKDMEEAMKTIREQMDKQHQQMEQMKHENDGELIACQSEMQLLRDQLAAKDSVLANKEKELEALRKSSDDQSAVGYVSDPDDDESDDDDENVLAPGVVPLPSAAETFAAQYAQGSVIAATADEETSVLRERLVIAEREKRKANQDLQKAARELQTQKDSLANAKMIISSLEKANKTMMEDLRSRLQDSNVAIASLLDKSMKHEETTAALKEEIDTLRRKKEEAEEKHKEEVKKYKEEALENIIKIAAQEREIMDLKSSIKNYADTLKDDDISLMSSDTHASHSQSIASSNFVR